MEIAKEKINFKHLKNETKFQHNKQLALHCLYRRKLTQNIHLLMHRIENMMEFNFKTGNDSICMVAIIEHGS